MTKFFDKPGRKTIRDTLLYPVFLGTIIFISTGTFDLPRVWVFLFLFIILNSIGIAILFIHDPHLLKHREDWKKKKDTKPWDKIFLYIWSIITLFAMPIIAGLDTASKYRQLLDLEYCILGIILYFAGTFMIFWAMFTNTHFEATVRIQRDRNHKVITDGPYKYVRHPGYVGVILWGIAPPLIIGSRIALWLGLISALLIILRTCLEDKTLEDELTGYKEYQQKTRYRLLPLIW